MATIQNDRQHNGWLKMGTKGPRHPNWTFEFSNSFKFPMFVSNWLCTGWISYGVWRGWHFAYCVGSKNQEITRDKHVSKQGPITEVHSLVTLHLTQTHFIPTDKMYYENVGPAKFTESVEWKSFWFHTYLSLWSAARLISWLFAMSK